MGLGTAKNNNSTFLSIAGGFIWDRKKGEEDPNYAEQKYTRKGKEDGVRTGARYGDLTGMITNVMFRVHPQFGQNINVTFEAEGERFIVSIKTNNRYSQDMMKFLLKADLEKLVYMKPYDFIDSNKKHCTGISFKQDGVKVALRNDEAPDNDKGKDWFKTATKKEVGRFFEDLSDWYVAKIEEEICPIFTNAEVKAAPVSGLGTAKNEVNKDDDEDEEEAQTPKKEGTAKVTPLRMKKYLKSYIAENYPEKTLPKLDKEELNKWYNLAIAVEELPFPEEKKDEEIPEEEAKVSNESLDAQLDSLLK